MTTRSRLIKIRRALTPENSPEPQVYGDTHFMLLVRKQFNSAALSTALQESGGPFHVTPAQRWVLNHARALATGDSRQERLYSGQYNADKDPTLEIGYTERFIAVARRVVNDDKALAALIAGQLDAKDAKVLEKYRCPNLAALVRAKL